MSIRIVAPGAGPSRPLILIYHLTGGSKARPTFVDDRVRAAAGASGATIANYTAPVDPVKGTTGGAYRTIGAAAVDGQIMQSLADVKATLGAKLGCVFSRVVLVGFSEGCQGPRAQLATGAEPDAVVACDGIHGHFPTPDEVTEVAPWRGFFSTAASSGAVAVVTHTMIPTEPAFTMGQHMLRRILGVDAPTLDPGPDANNPAAYRRGLLAVYSYPGTTATDHAYQAQTVLPIRLREALVALGLVSPDEPLPVPVGEGGGVVPGGGGVPVAAGLSVVVVGATLALGSAAAVAIALALRLRFRPLADPSR